MIYISSSCVKNNTIKKSVIELVENGFKNIELSGGTEYYDGFEDDLVNLKEKFKLNFLCHNYFPPPKEHFVLNLASLNDAIYEKTIQHLKKSIKLSSVLGAKKFSFHAGFFMDISTNEIGKKISKNNLFDKQLAIQRFCDGYNELLKFAGDIELYVENNVISFTNFKTYNSENIFMLTNFNEYKELKRIINFKLLLDVGHLKVSANSLKLDFEEEFRHMIQDSDYLHINDNDGLHDLNHGLVENSQMVKVLQSANLANKDFTLEIYEPIASIKKSYDILERIIND